MSAGPDFSPENLAARTGGRWTTVPAVPLRGFHFDSRQIGAGGVFVALRTTRRDGHAFLGAAREAGAAAALVAKADATAGLPQLVVADPLTAFQTIAREHRRAFRGPVIGISGSAGKTSTKNLLALLLGGETGGVLATEGNLNNHLGVPLTLTRLDASAHRFAVIEAGISAPGEMQPLAAMIEPDVALITLVAPAHTLELGGLDGVAREKSVLPAATRPAGVAIFPGQAAAFPAFRELGVRTMVVEPADVIRPSAPPKDKVYFAVTQRGDSTAVALALRRTAAARVHVPPRHRRHGAKRRARDLRRPLARRAARDDPGAPRRMDARQTPRRNSPRRRPPALSRLLQRQPRLDGRRLGDVHAIAPADEPRLYVLGCMEELGPDAPHLPSPARPLAAVARVRPPAT
jgi:UDP-N-acetylmuramoyl-tripeptide--D-alanyl-D-alanine ligase